MSLAVLGGRQRGQVAIIMAISLTSLMGLTAIAVDLGFGYAHRREVQNAADTAALAGAQSLGRHIVYQTMTASERTTLGLTSDPFPTSNAIYARLQTAAASSIPPFTELGLPSNQQLTLTWPTGANDSLVAYYMVSDGANSPTITQGPTVNGGGAPPSGAVGIRVEAAFDSPTFFAQVMGITHVRVFATARSMLQPVVGTDEGGPFILCGAYNPAPTDYGAWLPYVNTPLAGTTGGQVASNPATGTNKYQILDTSRSPPGIVPAFVGQTFRLQDPQLDQGTAPSNVGGNCGVGANKFKGPSDPAPCNPPDLIPCDQGAYNGTRTGPQRDRVTGLPGCAPGGMTNNCVALIPIADNSNTSSNPPTLHVVTYRAFILNSPQNNVWDGTLLPAVLVDGQTAEGVINPNDPGTFAAKLACDPISATCPAY